jgi:dTDP-4-amino-4,6-dideoxygalactose transaminase
MNSLNGKKKFMNSKKVRFFSHENLPENIRREWISSISEVLDSNMFVGGRFVAKFEQDWSNFLEIEYSVGVGNGLDGLKLALIALGVGLGDYVAVPAHTFIATWLAIIQVGAIPIGVDIKADGLIDLEKLFSVEEKLTAVIPVHMHGNSVDMERLMVWARTTNTLVIEDCSQAHGAELNGRKVGTYGDLSVFSFYPTKNLGALGDAGIVSTGNLALSSKVRSLANYGASPTNKYVHTSLGFNSRLDPLQAAILGVNLKHLNSWNTNRLNLAKRYNELLRSFENIKIVTQGENCVFHHFAILVENRDNFRNFLLNEGVETEVHYPFTASSEIYRMLADENDQEQEKFPVAERIASSILSLPMHPWLLEEDMFKIETAFFKAASNGFLK